MNLKKFSIVFVLLPALMGGQFFPGLTSPNVGSANSDNLQQRAASGFGVEAVLAPLAPVDLIVSDISWTPSPILPGDTVTFTVCVTNQGSGGTESFGAFDVQYYIDGVNVGEGSVSSLAAGATDCSLTFNWTAGGPGSHTVRAYADSRNTIPESNQNNNDRTETFPVGPDSLPDLIVSDISWTPPAALPGNPITFTICVTNQGAAAAVGEFDVQYYIDGPGVGEGSLTGLAAGATDCSLTFTSTATATGSMSFRAYADEGQAIPESDETNNQRTESISLDPDLPDLIVSDITWTPSPILPGDELTFTVCVRNQGGGAVEGAFDVEYSINGAGVGEGSLSGLAAGVTDCSLTFSATAPGVGSHTVGAVVDAAGIIVESDETNNERIEPFTVETSELPDLIVSDIANNAGLLLVGYERTFTICVRNRGSEPVTGAFDVQYFIDGVNLGEGSLSGLGAGVTDCSLTFTWRASSGGPHTIGAYADGDNQIEEFDETNNAREEGIVVRYVCYVPQLVVYQFTTYVPQLVFGEPVVIPPDE